MKASYDWFKRNADTLFKDFKYDVFFFNENSCIQRIEKLKYLTFLLNNFLIKNL